MATLTIPLDRLEDVRPGDRLVAIDDVPVSAEKVFTSGPQRTRMGGPVGIPFRTDSPVEGYLYPDSLVERSITVERKAASLDIESKPAPKKARKPVTRTIDGLRLVSQGGGAWLTEDGRYEVRLNYGGLTECDADHPVRITRAMTEHAIERPQLDLSKTILWAVKTGKSGYLCYGGTEHQAPDTWIAWDNQRDDYAGPSGSHAESFTDAARGLAAYLRSQEG